MPDATPSQPPTPPRVRALPRWVARRWRLCPCPLRVFSWTRAPLSTIRSTHGRRMVQTFCASVLQIPISLGAIQKVLDRVAQAIDPYYVAIATQARQSAGNYSDETALFCLHTLHWLWVMAS